MKTQKCSLLCNTCILSSYLLYISLNRWYVSGRMSRMNGGEFFKFILWCWHNLTTLSISFQVLSSIRLSVESFGSVIGSANRPWSFWNIEPMCTARVRLLCPPDDILTCVCISHDTKTSWYSLSMRVPRTFTLHFRQSHRHCFRLTCPTLAWYSILHVPQQNSFIITTIFSWNRSHEKYHNVVRYHILLFLLRTDNSGYHQRIFRHDQACPLLVNYDFTYVRVTLCGAIINALCLNFKDSVLEIQIYFFFFINEFRNLRHLGKYNW